MGQSLRFRTSVSTQASVLRASLLLSLGLTSLACGGSAVTVSNGSNGGSAQGGSTTLPTEAGTGGTSSFAGGGAAGAFHSLAGMGPTGGTGPVALCSNPVDLGNGLTACSNGLVHRSQATACGVEAAGSGGADDGGAAAAAGAAGDGPLYSVCQTDSDCAGLVRGYCYSNGLSGELPMCLSGCNTDSDCSSGGLCICGSGNPGLCTSGTCSVDADCGANSLCARTQGPCGGAFFHCTTPRDECLTDADCRERFGDPVSCGYEDGHRACNQAVCGRPFLVAEAPRMAAVEPRVDWLDATLTPTLSELTPLERAQLAAHWARLGQLEHASIAAFARFNLQLLSLGAPSHLVEACNRALADETAHARSCFALASAYGGNAVGPARLDIEHCFEDTSLVAITKLVLREGCLGETVAALEAVAAAESASDPAVKHALERIARDELNHAELAFQFVRWVLSSSSPEVRHELAREAAQQLADFESEARTGERSPGENRLAAHGLLGSAALRAVHLAAARDVSRPLLAALFNAEEPQLV